jgi:hypothetical protein
MDEMQEIQKKIKKIQKYNELLLEDIEEWVFKSKDKRDKKEDDDKICFEITEEIKHFITEKIKSNFIQEKNKESFTLSPEQMKALSSIANQKTIKTINLLVESIQKGNSQTFQEQEEEEEQETQEENPVDVLVKDASQELALLKENSKKIKNSKNKVNGKPKTVTPMTSPFGPPKKGIGDVAKQSEMLANSMARINGQMDASGETMETITLKGINYGKEKDD